MGGPLFKVALDTLDGFFTEECKAEEQLNRPAGHRRLAYGLGRDLSHVVTATAAAAA